MGGETLQYSRFLAEGRKQGENNWYFDFREMVSALLNRVDSKNLQGNGEPQHLASGNKLNDGFGNNLRSALLVGAIATASVSKLRARR